MEKGLSETLKHTKAQVVCGRPTLNYIIERTFRNGSVHELLSQMSRIPSKVSSILPVLTRSHEYSKKNKVSNHGHNETVNDFRLFTNFIHEERDFLFNCSTWWTSSSDSRKVHSSHDIGFTQIHERWKTVHNKDCLWSWRDFCRKCDVYRFVHLFFNYAVSWYLYEVSNCI